VKFQLPLFKLLAATLIIAAGVSLPIGSQAEAQPATGGQKTVAVIAASGVDQLLTDIDYVGNLVGRPNMRQEAEGMLQLFTGNKQLPGVDETKNWGVVVVTDGTNFEPLVCIPVTDLSALLTLLQNFQINASDLGDGLTELELPNQSLYVKEVNGWAFAAQSPESLDNAPADPDALLKEVSGEYDLGIQVTVQNVPEMFREIALTNLQGGLDEGLQQEADETPEEFAKRREAAMAQLDEIRRLFNEVEQLTVGISIDQEQQGIVADMVYSGVPNTRTAREIEALGGTKSRFAKVAKPDSSVQFNVATEVAEQDREQYRAQMESSLQASLEQAYEKIEEEETDPAKQQLAKDGVTALFEVLKSALSDGRMDASGYVIAQQDRLVAAGAIETSDATAVNQMLDKIKALAESEPEKVTVTMDSATHNEIPLHSIKVAIDAEEAEQLRPMLGEDALQIYVGSGPDATYFAAGRDALTAIQEAIDATDPSATTEVTPLEFKMAFGHFLQIAANQGPLAGNPAIEQVVTKISDEGKDHVIMTAELVEGAARMRLSIEQGVIEALGVLGRAASAQFAQ
jgi:hypothetical protein